MATATLKKYGAGHYPDQATKPIGGGEGYLPIYTIKDATIIVETLAELTAALAAAHSGDIIWIVDGAVLKITASYGKLIKRGVVLAAGRGQTSKPGMIRSWYNPAAYMVGLLRMESFARVFGLTILGPTGYGAIGPAGPCAIRADGAKGTLIENTEVGLFSGAGVWFGDSAADISVWNDDAQRNILRGVYVHDIMRHGFGYGVGEQGARQSFKLEASRVERCRHLVMGQAGSNSWELQHCDFGDSLYGYKGNPDLLYHNHQIDSHGDDGGSASPPAGYHRIMTYCDLSDNAGTTSHGNKQNLAIRGVPGVECDAAFNWTKKTTHSGLFTETNPENSAFEQRNIGSAFKNMRARDNWYGLEEPPDEPGPVQPNFVLSALMATPDPSEHGADVTISVNVANTGHGAGSTIVVLRVNGIVEESRVVNRAAGESAVETFPIGEFPVGKHIASVGDLSVIFEVIDTTPQPVADLHVTSVTTFFDTAERALSVSATVLNQGGAAGNVEIEVEGQMLDTVEIPAGGSDSIDVKLKLA